MRATSWVEGAGTEGSIGNNRKGTQHAEKNVPKLYGRYER